MKVCFLVLSGISIRVMINSETISSISNRRNLIYGIHYIFVGYGEEQRTNEKNYRKTKETNTKGRKRVPRHRNLQILSLSLSFIKSAFPHAIIFIS